MTVSLDIDLAPAVKRAKTKPKWRDLSWSERYARQKALWHYQLVRLDHDDVSVLRRIARQQNISVTELIRTFITWGLEEYDITRARVGRED
jgi:hypothetical protein